MVIYSNISQFNTTFPYPWILESSIKSINSKLILNPTTIYVGVNRTLTSLQQAWNSIATTAFTAPVTIQTDDGMYSQTAPIVLSNHPTPQMITIQGNPIDESKVVLQFPLVNAALTCFSLYGPGASGIIVQSITVTGHCRVVFGIYQGAYLNNEYARPLIIKGTDSIYGLVITGHSGAILDSVKVSGCETGIRSEDHSHIKIVSSLILTGTSSTAGNAIQVLYPSSVTILTTGGQISQYPNGHFCSYGGKLYTVTANPAPPTACV
jgi:hypothetical protein